MHDFEQSRLPKVILGLFELGIKKGRAELTPPSLFDN